MASLQKQIIRLTAQILNKLVSPKLISSWVFRYKFGRFINWNNPQDLNEKINWLKFNTDTEQWTRLADKYAVREFVEQCGLKDLLVKLYGVWDDADNIDFESLPQQFVLKSNNGSGDIIIVKDKSKEDLEQLRKRCAKMLKTNYGVVLSETHYYKIPRKIIAEELLDATKQSAQSKSLIDYKIWCFNGKPYCVLTVANRESGTCELDSFDINWNHQREMMTYAGHIKHPTLLVPRPTSLDKMLEAATIMSKGHPQVRVDFYEIDGKPYFGELTFTSNGGFMRYYTQKALLEMGQQIRL